MWDLWCGARSRHFCQPTVHILHMVGFTVLSDYWVIAGARTWNIPDQRRGSRKSWGCWGRGKAASCGEPLRWDHQHQTTENLLLTSFIIGVDIYGLVLVVSSQRSPQRSRLSPPSTPPRLLELSFGLVCFSASSCYNSIVLTILWSQPCAVYVQSVDKSDDCAPAPQIPHLNHYERYSYFLAKFT